MKRTLLFIAVAVCILISREIAAQNANISYEVRISNANGVRSTMGSWSSGSSCYETGEQEYTASLMISGPTAGSTICVTCNNSSDCNYGHGTVLRTLTNVSTSFFMVNYDMFEDDGGTRCAYDGGDDCYGNGSFAVYMVDAYLPTAANSYVNYTDDMVYNSGSSEHWVRLDNSWRYAGNSSALVPTCSQQSTSYAAGQIRSWSVNLTAGVTYNFNNCGNTEDTYIRIFGTNGYTVVASADQGCTGVNSSSVNYTPTASGIYYVELSHYSRSSLVSNGVLNYSMVAPAAVTVSGGGTFCGSSITLTASGGAGGTIYWQGTTSGGTSTATPATTHAVSASGTYYFRSRSAGGCWGPEGSATVTLNSVPSAPTGNANQYFCNAATVANLSATGSIIKWYAAASGGSALATSTPLVNGSHYYASQTVSGCESTNRLNVTATITASSPALVSVAPNMNNICEGSTVTFTATPTNGGTPIYQWYKNNVAVGTNSSSYSFIPLQGDQVYCVMTSSEMCATGNPATSNVVGMTVNTLQTVSVNAQPSQNNVCAGTTVNFTATPTNGGGTPSYQWYKNSLAVGTNSASYVYVPVDGDQLYCVMTSSAACITGNPATSNTVVMTVHSPVAAGVSIQVNQNNVCAGTLVNFTAIPANGGTPTYQWYVNGASAGINAANYSYIPANNDQVHCIMTSSALCATGNPATSNTVAMVVTSPLPVSVNVQPSQNNICAGSSVVFTALPDNGGTPAYQWYKNGLAVSANFPTFTDIPANGDQVYVVMTSSLSCVTNNPATSGTVSMIVNPCTGIESTALEGLFVYPNPAEDRLYVNFAATNQVAEVIKLINALGQIVFETEDITSVKQNGIDVSKLSAGLYTLQIVVANGVVIKEVVVR